MRKSKLEWALYIKWFPIFRENTHFTQEQIDEYKNDLNLLKR